MPAIVRAALLLATIAGVTVDAQQVGPTPVDVTIGTAITPLIALGRAQLVYELHLTNLGARPLRLDVLELLNEQGVPIDRLAGARIAQRTSVFGTTPARTENGPALPVGVRAVVFQYVSLAPNAAVPTRVRHRLVFSGDDGRADTLVTNASAVGGANATAISSPVRAGPWIALRGPSGTSGHRLSLVTLDGAVRVPQRFAVDWAKLGADGRMFRGDSTKVESWNSYGDTVYAVGDGKVVTARDGMSNNVPFAAVPTTAIDAHDATGNLLVVQLADGRYATFAHLMQGSQRVKLGDVVREGQPLARIGNSGNTFAPHLHFQLGDGPETLASEGVPFTFREFELLGRINGIGPLLGGGAWTPLASQPARTVRVESPLENMVVRFDKR